MPTTTRSLLIATVGLGAYAVWYAWKSRPSSSAQDEFVAQARRHFHFNSASCLGIPRLPDNDVDVLATITKHRLTATGTLEYIGMRNSPVFLMCYPVLTTLHCRCVFGRWYPVSWESGWRTRPPPSPLKFD